MNRNVSRTTRAALVVVVLFAIAATSAASAGAVTAPQMWLSQLTTPAGGFAAQTDHGIGAGFLVGAASVDFTPPLSGQAPGGDPANCRHPATYNGPRQFAYEEPYIDVKRSGHFDDGDPYIDCNGNGRWDGNLLGGGSATPRFYDHIADNVGARAIVVRVGTRTLAVEVLDQEGMFNVYQDRIRAQLQKDGVHLSGVFISANHDESAPDSLGLGGVSQTTSGVNAYWTAYMVTQSAKAIERAYRSLRPARIRYTEVLEPPNLRQCWSSYPYVDDQHIPVLEAVDIRNRSIATLANVSQHVETLGFNGGTPALSAQNLWVSSDWVHFFRSSLEQRLGGVAIEMAGSVGSVESPEVYPQAISRTPQQFVDASHPAGCRTLFRAGGGTDTAGSGHTALGYPGETKVFGETMAAPITRALTTGAYHYSASNMLWGVRSTICVPLTNALFTFGASLGVFAVKPGYNADCSKANTVAPNGASGGDAERSSVAAFRIGDGEFISVPGEVFPFTYLRGFLGPQDMPDPSAPLPPWLLPHMTTPFRFIDGLGEDMLGYIFPRGNAVGIPSASNLNPSDRDRFGCGHSDDGEAASANTADIAGRTLQRVLDARAHGETIAHGRYVLPDGTLSRDPLGGPVLNCTTQTTYTAAAHPARSVRLANGRRVTPTVWMSLSGLPQRVPDRDTRGYFDARGHRVWLDVFQ